METFVSRPKHDFPTEPGAIIMGRNMGPRSIMMDRNMEVIMEPEAINMERNIGLGPIMMEI